MIRFTQIIPFGIIPIVLYFSYLHTKGMVHVAKKPESKRIEVERMKELMGEMTQQQFQEKTGVPQSSISKILGNQRDLTANNICLIAEAFDVSTDWLLGRTDERKPPEPVKKSEEPTYGDIFEVVTYLLKKNAVTAWQDSFLGVDEREHKLNSVQSLFINDEILKSMFYEWVTMQSAPKDVYDDWNAKRVDAYSTLQYLSWDADIASAFHHFYGGSGVTPDTLAYFQKNLREIFKEIRAEQENN